MKKLSYVLITLFLLATNVQAQDKISNLTLPAIQSSIFIFKNLDQIRSLAVRHHDSQNSANSAKKQIEDVANEIKNDIERFGYNFLDLNFEEIYEHNFIMLTQGNNIYVYFFGASQRHMNNITDDHWVSIPHFEGLVREGVYNFFRKQYEIVTRKMNQWFHDNKLSQEETKIYVIGHSMGGALSALTTLHLQRDFPHLNFEENVKTILFGSIPVFDATLGATYDAKFKYYTLNIVHVNEPHWPFFVPLNKSLSQDFKPTHIGQQIISPEPSYNQHKIEGYHESLKLMTNENYIVTENWLSDRLSLSISDS